tara:strand:- start:267 stop:485 length:219 start_codon:yes stop_codon:yes gene_type:complete
MKYKYTNEVVVEVELKSSDAGLLVDALAIAYEHGEGYRRSHYQRLINNIVQAFNSNEHGKIYEPELKIASEK